ncbi:MAG: hypothetical protein WD274_10055 [Acidimicrobiia bacterium]
MTAVARSVLVLLLVVLTTCGTPAEPSASGDGVLDCYEGQVHRGADIRVSGSTETEVVEDALAEWVEEGAEIVERSGDESWAAVENGRDVAIAYPEVEGDGAWVVHDVQVCGEPDTGPAPTDGSLDCVNEASWIMQASFDPEIPGDPNPGDAALKMLQAYQDGHGGEIVFIDDNTASLLIDDREQVVATAIEVPAGGWAVSTVSGCEGYDL